MGLGDWGFLGASALVAFTVRRAWRSNKKGLKRTITSGNEAVSVGIFREVWQCGEDKELNGHFLGRGFKRWLSSEHFQKQRRSVEQLGRE